MESSACKHGEHDLCHPKGKVTLQVGKTIRCGCECHHKSHDSEDRKF